MKKFSFDNLTVSDRELYDTIYSMNQKLPVNLLEEICRKRGIIISNEDVREDISLYISGLFFDWYAIEDLLNNINMDERNHRVTTTVLEGINDIQDIKNALSEIAVDADSNLFNFKLNKDNSIKVNLGITKPELSNTRLIQKSIQDSNIEFIIDDGKLLVRSSSNEQTLSITEKIIAKASEKTGKKINEQIITLEEIRSCDLRSKFFLDLIRLGGKDYSLIDVTRIKVAQYDFSKKGVLSIKDDIDPEESTESRKEQEIITKINSVLFSGNGLHTADLLKTLRDDGHYITEIGWIVQSNKTPFHRIEFFSGFQNSNKCTLFHHDVKGYYEKKSNGEYKLNRIKFLEVERSKILLFFEKHSYLVLEKIKGEFNASLLGENENG